jgi:hypothetical protein
MLLLYTGHLPNRFLGHAHYVTMAMDGYGYDWSTTKSWPFAKMAHQNGQHRPVPNNLKSLHLCMQTIAKGDIEEAPFLHYFEPKQWNQQQQYNK